MAYKRKPATSKFRNEIVYPNLKSWLDSNNVNAFEFAKMLDIPPTTLYEYLKGKTESLKLIRKIKAITHLEWKDLITD
jgi:predicted transcriptional regulator